MTFPLKTLLYTPTAREIIQQGVRNLCSTREGIFAEFANIEPKAPTNPEHCTFYDQR